MLDFILARRERAYCLRAIEAHQSAAERARELLRWVGDEEEAEYLRVQLASSEREIAIWQQHLEGTQ